MNQIVRHFLNVPMSLSFDGLSQLATADGYDPSRLKPGEFLLFINRPFTAYKMFGAGHSFFYHRDPRDRLLDPRALVKAVEQFDGSHVNYSTALAATIASRLDKDVKRALDRADQVRLALRKVEGDKGSRVAARHRKGRNEPSTRRHPRQAAVAAGHRQVPVRDRTGQVVRAGPVRLRARQLQLRGGRAHP